MAVRTRKGKQISPLVAAVVIVLVLAAIGLAGYEYLKPKREQVGGPPPMTAQERKQRQAESAVWDEERKRAKAEGRLPDYTKLPRTGHPGAPGPVPKASPSGE